MSERPDPDYRDYLEIAQGGDDDDSGGKPPRSWHPAVVDQAIREVH